MAIDLNEIVSACSNIEQIYIILEQKLKKIKTKNTLCSNCTLVCCTNTVNMEVTSLEWNLIKDILIENKELIDKVKENSKNINIKNNLSDLLYNCPFFIDNKCSIHSYRPLFCRTYGYFYKNNYDKTSCSLIKNNNEVFDETNSLFHIKTMINKLNSSKEKKSLVDWVSTLG